VGLHRQIPSKGGRRLAQGLKMIRVIKKNVRSALVVAATAAAAMGQAHAADMPVKAKPVPAVPFFFVNDTSISFTYFPDATDPGVSGGSNIVPGGIAGEKNTFARYQGSIDHFDVWQYGTNLIHGEFNQYGPQDPTEGTPGAAGSREFFGFAQSTLGFNELSHSKAFSTFLTKDVSFMFRITAGVQDDFLNEQTTQYAPGLLFDLNAPGAVEVGIAAYKEFTNNSFNVCGPPGFGAMNGPAAAFSGGANTCIGGGSFNGTRDFEWTWKLFSFISEPLTFLPPSIPLTWVNVMNVTGPKGTGISAANCIALGCGGPLGAFANNETKTEVFEDTRLSLDASKVWWGKPGIWDLYVGYRYWYNKFGTNHNAALFATVAPDTSIESTAYVGTTYHFK
jgi:hypothetical protein